MHRFSSGLGKMKDIQFSYLLVSVGKPNQPVTVKIGGNCVLVELKLPFAEGLAFAHLKVHEVDWREHIQVSIVFLFTLKLDGHHNALVLVIQSESPLTIGLMRDVIWIIDELPEVLSCQGLCIQSLARDISD